MGSDDVAAQWILDKIKPCGNYGLAHCQPHHLDSLNLGTKTTHSGIMRDQNDRKKIMTKSKNIYYWIFLLYSNIFICHYFVKNLPHDMQGIFISVFLSPAFLWQLMRFTMLQLLRNLRSHSQGKEITDADILNWANNKVKRAGRTSQMDSFKV